MTASLLSIRGIQDDYLLSGSSLTVASGIIEVLDGVTASIDTSIISPAGITKVDPAHCISLVPRPT